MIDRFALSFLCIELDRNVRTGVTGLYILLTIQRAIIGVPLTSLVDCIDAILLNDPEDSLESLKHQRRGTGPRTRIRDGHTQIRKHDLNSGFLKNKDHKKELLSFHCEHIDKKRLCGKLLLSTKCACVLSNIPCDV